jgi:uncharacterized protein YmfQ (DUF2313 family)
MSVRSPAAYARQLVQLLPRGAAWNRAAGAVLLQLLEAIADSLARVDRRASALVEEANPLSTLELLPDWERVAGLPDSCAPIADSIRERQIAVARKLATIGGQSRTFLIELAGLIGVRIEIDEFRPFTTLTGCDQPICDDEWRFAFTVRVLPDSQILTDPDGYREGWLTTTSGCDERLRSQGIEALECLILAAKPAHSFALFAYPADPEPILWFDHLSNQGAY